MWLKPQPPVYSNPAGNIKHLKITVLNCYLAVNCPSTILTLAERWTTAAGGGRPRPPPSVHFYPASTHAWRHFDEENFQCDLRASNPILPFTQRISGVMEYSIHFVWTSTPAPSHGCHGGSGPPLMFRPLLRLVQGRHFNFFLRGQIFLNLSMPPDY